MDQCALWYAAASAAPMLDFLTTTAGKPLVVLSSPANPSTLGRSVAIQASAIPTIGHVITGWHISVDGVVAYNAYQTISINPTLNLSFREPPRDCAGVGQLGSLRGRKLFRNGFGKTSCPGLNPKQLCERRLSPQHSSFQVPPLQATAFRGWWIYVDGVAAYNAVR